MKVIRFTDDRFIVDLGPEVGRDFVEQFRQYWADWMKTKPDLDAMPTALVIGGSTYPLEYEDRRETDIDSHFRAIEERLDRLLALHAQGG